MFASNPVADSRLLFRISFVSVGTVIQEQSAVGTSRIFKHPPLRNLETVSRRVFLRLVRQDSGVIAVDSA